MNDKDSCNASDQFQVMFNKDDEQCHLNGLPLNPENEHFELSLDKVSEQDETWGSLSGLYGEILIIITGAVILKETLYGSMSSNNIHDYLFLCLQIVGIGIIIGGYATKLISVLNSSTSGSGSKHTQFKLSSNGVLTFDLNNYFKIGAIMFGLVVIINSLLEVVSSFMTPTTCINPLSLSQPILRSLFVFLQMCFLKDTEQFMAIFRSVRLFVLMHLFASNVALWIHLLFWESAKDWDVAFHIKHNSSLRWDRSAINITLHALESDIYANDTSEHYPSHIVHYTESCWWRVQKSENFDVTAVQLCLQNSTIGKIWEKTNQFSYPILSQYYFLITSILYVTWANFKNNYNLCLDHNCWLHKKESSSQSTKGFFLGSMIFVTTILNVILFFTVDKYLDLMINIMYCVLFGLSSVAALLGLFQVKRTFIGRICPNMKFNMLFQKIGLFSVFVFGSSGIMFGSLSETKHIIHTFGGLSMILQGVFQYLFINKVYRKRTTVSNVQEKLCRQLIVFLIFCNVFLFVFDGFVAWNRLQNTFNDPRWLVLMRFVFPFVVFYRYHSSAILIQVWTMSYNSNEILSEK